MRALARGTLAALAAALLASSAPDARAEPAAVPTPSDLPDGAEYHLIFNATTFVNALSADIADYDQVAQDAADEAGLGASEGIVWSAVASTPAVDARDHAVVGADTPVYNMNLERVADGFADLWDGELAATLDVDEYGVPNTVDTWTGTLADGTGAPGFTLGSADRAWCGRPTSATSEWIAFTTPSAAGFLKLYALSEALTVPQPASVSMGLAALLCLTALRRVG